MSEEHSRKVWGVSDVGPARVDHEEFSHDRLHLHHGRHCAAFASAAATTLVLATAAPAAAQDPTHDLTLEPGVACADFAVGLDVVGGKRNVREFTDKDGEVVRILVTGRAEAVVLTNLEEPEKSVTAPSRGAATRVTVNGDGTSTVTHTGNLVLFLFPTDDPAGPSTTLVQGRTVFTVAPDPIPDSDLLTVQSITGRTTDLCAALAE